MEGQSVLFLAVIALGEASFGGFPVEAREVMPGFVHHLHDPVEAHHVRAVGERGVGVGVECPGRGDGVALDAGDLTDEMVPGCEVWHVYSLGSIFDARKRGMGADE